jgi:DNA-binding response OmpR family regulator
MGTVLIFDSSAVTCHTVSKQLRTYGFDTIQARWIGGARVALATKPVDLVILDLAAPDAGGMTLLSELRQACPSGDRTCKKVPVIILTSSARESDRVDARAAGAVAFLTKPVSTRELLFTVNSALTLHAPAAQASATRQPEHRAGFPVPVTPAPGTTAPVFPRLRYSRPEWAVATSGSAG